MYDNYGIDTMPIEGIATGAGVAAIIAIVALAIIVIALVVLILVSNCKIFKKAGETWWKGLIPLYNSWVETKIAGLAWYWFLIFVILTAIISQDKDYNFVIYMALCLTSFNYNYNLAKKFGKSNGFAVLSSILPFVGLPILAFGSAQYNKDAKVDKDGIFSIKNW